MIIMELLNGQNEINIILFSKQTIR